MTAITGKDWKEQWARVHRWRERVRKSATGFARPASENFTYDPFVDDSLALVQAIWHLKDWLKHDRTFTKSDREIEDYAHQTDPLPVIGDLANGSKHMVLNKPATDATTTTGTVHVIPGGTVNEYRVLTFAEVDGQVVEIGALADQAIATWQQFIT